MSDTGDPQMSPIEVMARAMWQEESIRAFGKPRNIAWAEIGDKEKMKWSGLATAALLALSQMEPTAEMLMDGYAPIAETKVSGVSGMTIDAQWKARGAKANACFKAMLAAAIND